MEGFDDWDIDDFTNFDKPKKAKKVRAQTPITPAPVENVLAEGGYGC